MKQLVELIEIEKSFTRKKKSLQKDYSLKSQEYITKSKETINNLKQELLNKNQIVQEKLSAYNTDISESEKNYIKIDSAKIKKLILSQL